jgi:hypothetical protein
VCIASGLTSANSTASGFAVSGVAGKNQLRQSFVTSRKEAVFLFNEDVDSVEKVNRFRRITLIAMHEFVARGLAEGMVEPRVQIGQRLQDVFVFQTRRDTLRRGPPLARMELGDRLICHSREFKQMYPLTAWG